MGTRPTVAILGAGAIGEALASGLLASGWPADDLILVARRAGGQVEVEATTGIRCLLDPLEAVAGRAVIVVAVKPSDVGRLLTTLRGAVKPDQLVLSLAAGVPTTVFEEALGAVPVIRAMPNTPARISEAITALARGAHVNGAALARGEAVLGAVGETIVLDEQLLDAVTAVSGTGPAYVFLLAEALIDAAIREGLPRHAAERLVVRTLRGSGMLLAASDATPAQLRAQVTSPGGTTAAAVHLLEGRGFRALVEDAVQAAARRSRELGERAEGG